MSKELEREGDCSDLLPMPPGPRPQGSGQAGGQAADGAHTQVAGLQDPHGPAGV